MRNNILFFTAIFCFFFCLGAEAQENIVKNPSLEYVEKVSKQLNVPKKYLCYPTTASKPHVENEVYPSLVSFVKGDLSASGNDIIDNFNEGDVIASCRIDEITESQIENKLNPDKNYDALVIKSIIGEKVYSFSKNKAVSILLYSEQLGGLIEPCIEGLKRLKNMTFHI